MPHKVLFEGTVPTSALTAMEIPLLPAPSTIPPNQALLQLPGFCWFLNVPGSLLPEAFILQFSLPGSLHKYFLCSLQLLLKWSLMKSLKSLPYNSFHAYFLHSILIPNCCIYLFDSLFTACASCKDINSLRAGISLFPIYSCVSPFSYNTQNLVGAQCNAQMTVANDFIYILLLWEGKFSGRGFLIQRLMLFICFEAFDM